MGYLLGEVQELVEAVLELNLDHIREEWNDVMLCTLCWLAKFLPIGRVRFLPGMGLSSAKKFAGRRQVWKDIFAHHGTVFRKEYLIAGGNYRKRHKVQRVLALGEVHEVDWLWVEAWVGGFEG